ncbi:hypothetical protein Bca4012_028524 [Brassica carinata]|uniref:Uncharacterized protein n=1 Tax=Brassica carinata TaxID=52824 RepID=A0A8X7RP54_BRACI|nr:hypothetical protein Bca52824_050247 [Brassica carinata]
MHLCETAHSHVPCRKQRRIRWLRSRDTVDFTGSEITVGCLIEHSTGTHRDRKLETRTNDNGDRSPSHAGDKASQASLKEPSLARKEVGQVVAEETVACRNRSPITGSQSRRRNRQP